eukprot:3724487-Amphidinium_carterae.2
MIVCFADCACSGANCGNDVTRHIRIRGSGTGVYVDQVGRSVVAHLVTWKRYDALMGLSQTTERSAPERALKTKFEAITLCEFTEGKDIFTATATLPCHDAYLRHCNSITIAYFGWGRSILPAAQ